MVTGGTAGIAFVLHYATQVPFGLAFFVLNLPFYGLAWKRMGRRFTLKTPGCGGFAGAAVRSAAALAGACSTCTTLFAAAGGGPLAGAGFHPLPPPRQPAG